MYYSYPYFYPYPYYAPYHISQNYLINPPIKLPVYSNNKPLCGEDNRSSNNFPLPKNTPKGTYSIQAPPNITFNVMIDKTGVDSTPGKKLSNGGTITLSPGNDYYIASPKNATTPFYVIFTGPFK